MFSKKENKNLFLLLTFLFLFPCFLLSQTIVANAETFESIRVLTINSAQLPLPGPLKKIGHKYGFGLNMSDNKKRARKLSDKIQSFWNGRRGPDVIAIQELFDLDSASEIKKAIRHIYPHTSIDSRWGSKMGLGMQSGLAIFSRYPIIAHKIYEYKAHRGVENFARKGMMGVKIQLPSGKIINVFTTHLQAGASNDSVWAKFDDSRYANMSTKDIRFHEMKEAKERLILPFSGPKELVILMGDFNLDYRNYGGEDDRYFDILQMMNLQETLRAEDAHHGTAWDMNYWEKKKKARTNKNFPIDHIWVSKSDSTSLQNLNAVSWVGGEITPNITDHLEVWGDISFNAQ